MKKFFVFVAMTIVSLLAYAQGTCETVPSEFTGNASITFLRYPRKVLQGRFAVSASDTVRFSQGNLQYRATTGKWRFAINQYDKIGDGNENISENYDGWIDLFGWGCSGWDNGARRGAYMPYETSEDNTQYVMGSPGSTGKISLIGAYAHADWAWHNPIINGGSSTGPSDEQWRILTEDEWLFLFSGRNKADEKRSQAMVCGIHGYIFLPETWTLPEGLSFTADANSWTTNSYDSSDWEKMETAGAVFLPACGWRKGYSLKEITPGTDLAGRYWSTTYRTNSGGEILYFKETDASVGVTGQNFFGGASVRPVQKY